MVRHLARRQAGAPDFPAVTIMTASPTPRQMVKALVRGEPPSRPLLLPIIFSLGARMENLPLRTFQGNPTKIANALRQVRNVLRVDGLTCYYDPCLEVEALGCQRDWRDDGSSSIAAPSFSSVSDLRAKLNPPDGLAGRGHIATASDVLRRLKVMLKDEPASMIRVSGPFTLAAQLLGTGAQTLSQQSPPRELVEFAAEVSASVSKTFVEAGADVILLTENSLCELTTETADWYASLLSPIANVIRFYEALPVLFVAGAPVSERNLQQLQKGKHDCTLCWTLSLADFAEDSRRHLQEGISGIALPAQIFYAAQSGSKDLPSQFLSDSRIAFLTSSGDLTESTDLKHLTRALNTLRNNLGHAAPSR